MRFDNIDKIKGLNAYCYRDDDSARAKAKRSDSRRKSGEAGLLEGIPLAHKDLFAIQDMPTQAASKILQNFKPPYTATVIERLRRSRLDYHWQIKPR